MQQHKRPIISYRQSCPGCHSDMMYMRKYQVGATKWADIWYCIRCKREIVVDKGGDEDA